MSFEAFLSFLGGFLIVLLWWFFEDLPATFRDFPWVVSLAIAELLFVRTSSRGFRSD